MLRSAFARVEGIVERQPVVALRDRFVGVLQCLLRRFVFVGRVQIGARGLRRVDGSLRLLDFLFGWIAACTGRLRDRDGAGQKRHAGA
jgi:hypothetical protein